MKKLVVIFAGFIFSVLFASCSDSILGEKFSELYNLEMAYHKLDTLQSKNVFTCGNAELIKTFDNKIKISDEEIKSKILKLKKEKENLFVKKFMQLTESEKNAYKKKINDIKNVIKESEKEREEALKYLKESK